MIKDKLQELGFSEKEVRVYLALLEMGSAVASDIAKKAGLKRSTAYVILDSLAGRGLTSMVERRGVQLYSAAPPEQLVQYLKDMSSRYAGFADAAKELIPELPSSSHAKNAPAPKVHFFKGGAGMKTVYEDTLASLEEIRVHAAFAHGKVADAAAPHKKPSIKMQIVFPESSGKAKEAAYQKDALRKAVIASREKSGVSSEINVYDDRVVFISTAEDFALVIESRELADVLRKTFTTSSQEPEPKRAADGKSFRPSFAF